MITNQNFAKDGRTGNQLFQYSAIVGLALKNNYDYCLPLDGSDLKYFNTTSANCNISSIKLNIEKEVHFFDKKDIFDKPDNTSYIGHFQDYRYFEHCKDFIRKELSFKDNKLKYSVDSWFNDKQLVSMHIRRTDYLSWGQFFNIPTKEWYIQAMTFFPDQIFIIFSDDKKWCINTFGNLKNVIISPFNHYIEDLYAMTKCVGHIIPNSTFSWWGAYLSNSKLVIIPETWGGNNTGRGWFKKCCSFKLPSWQSLKLKNQNPFTEVFA